MLIEVGYPLQSHGAPKIRQRYVRRDRSQFDCRIERKRRAVGHEAGEGITIEMVSMSRIRGPVGVCTVRRNHLYAPARSGNAVQFADKRHHIGNVLDDVTADNLIELVISKWIRQYAQIVRNIGVSAGI